jgi:hypothetical protein
VTPGHTFKMADGVSSDHGVQVQLKPRRASAARSPANRHSRVLDVQPGVVVQLRTRRTGAGQSSTFSPVNRRSPGLDVQPTATHNSALGVQAQHGGDGLEQLGCRHWWARSLALGVQARLGVQRTSEVRRARSGRSCVAWQVVFPAEGAARRTTSRQGTALLGVQGWTSCAAQLTGRAPCSVQLMR